MNLFSKIRCAIEGHEYYYLGMSDDWTEVILCLYCRKIKYVKAAMGIEPRNGGRTG